MCKSSKTTYSRQSSDNRLKEMDFSELETRTLAYLQKDAENMGDGQTFSRASDPVGLDTGKLRRLIAAKDAKNSLKEGCLDPVEIRKSQTAELFECEIGEVTEDMMRFAKSYTIAEMYGADPEMIRNRMQDSLAEAKQRLDES